MEDDDSDIGARSPRMRFAFHISILGCLLLLVGLVIIIGPVVVLNPGGWVVTNYIITGGTLSSLGFILIIISTIWCWCRKLQLNKALKESVVMRSASTSFTNPQLSVLGSYQHLSSVVNSPLRNLPVAKQIVIASDSEDDDGGFKTYVPSGRRILKNNQDTFPKEIYIDPSNFYSRETPSQSANFSYYNYGSEFDSSM